MAQQDVWSNPEWLRQMASRHDALGAQARQRIQDMQQEAALGQQRDVHSENVRVREQGQRNTDRARTDTLAENERVHRDAAAQRALESQRLTDYRNATLGQQQENAQSRRDLGLLNLAQSPELMTAFGKQAPAIQKELLNRFFAAQQGSGAAGAGPTGGATLAALGGTAAADAGTNAVRNFHVQQGRATAPSPTTVAPSAAAAKAQAQPPAPQGGGLAPGIDLVEGGGAPPALELPAGQYRTPEGVPSIGGSPVIPANRLVQHGQVYGGPPGYDLNINTGEYVPSNTVGTINGRPAGQVIAEGAQRTGIAPESPSGTAALSSLVSQQNLARGTATTPPINVPFTEPPPVGTVEAETANAAGGGTPAGGGQRSGLSQFATKYLSPPGTDVGALFGGGQGATPIVQQPTAPAQGATNRPFYGSPELANATTTGGAPPRPATVGIGFEGHPIGEVPVSLGLGGRSNTQQDISARQPVPAAGPPPGETAANTRPPVSRPAPPIETTPTHDTEVPTAPTTFSDITEPVPPPAPETVPAGLTRPRSPNEVVVEGQTPNVVEYLQNKYPQLSPEQRAALDEQRRRGLQ